MKKIVHLKDLTNLPLSSNQERLWIISQKDKSDATYNLQLTYHLEGEIDIATLRKSMKLLFDRQHTLFSVFKQKDGVPYISIIPVPVTVELIDFSGLPLKSGREKILSYAGEQSRIPFDIENGPLYRMFILKEDEKNFFFCAIIHHLIFDGFSRRIFVEELSRIYNNLILGASDTVEPLEFQSYDFAALEKETLSQEEEKDLNKFWKEYLKECSPELKFPADFPRSNNPKGLGCREPFRISREYSQKLRIFSQKSETSVFNTLLSILGILFQKSSGGNDICIGIPVSNRRSYSSFKIFGFFVNTLPIRFLISESNSFIEHISRTSEIFNKGVRNLIPFDKIVKILNPERIPGLNPFFQICFSWFNNFTIPMDLGGITGKMINVPNGISAFDITFYMWENGEFIEGVIEYNNELFKSETIIRLRDNFLTLVKRLLENPDAPLGSLPMISDAEKEIINGFNNTRTDYPKEKTIVQLFEEQVNLYPDKEAVVFKESSLTYRQLNEKSNQLARFLRNSGVRANEPVGILVDESVEMIVGIFGILKAGGAYVPLDLEYPEQRKNFILSDSGCRILITRDKYITETDDGVIKLSLDSFESYHNDKSNVEGINTSSDLAYIIYTSGTTGIPKGTLIPQQGVVRLILNNDHTEITHEDRVLQTSALVFDASTETIFGALLKGSTLYLVDKETLLDPNEFGEVLAINDITITSLTPALFNLIAESNSDIFYKLKKLILGGDVLSAPHVNKVRKKNPQLIIINAYGPTENSCNSTTYKIERDFDYNIPIGKPINNSTAYIFDKYMNYEPIGIIGELYVGGDGLSNGYLNRADLNRTSFINHPHFPGERLYKTGDLARWLPDGNIEFHGRIDNQIKIRGFRIELEEIETALTEIEEITKAIVKPIKIDTNDIRLVAFLDVQGGSTIDINGVSGKLRKRLPSYMIPSAYKIVDGFPITVNGKIDRKALTIDLSEMEDEKTVDSKELSPTQQKIIKIWMDIIKTKSIGISDNFFDVGGTSLLAIWVVDRIAKEFSVILSLREFFESPKIQSLAEMIDIKINSKKTAGKKDNQQKIKKEFKIIKGEL